MNELNKKAKQIFEKRKNLITQEERKKVAKKYLEKVLEIFDASNEEKMEFDFEYVQSVKLIRSNNTPKIVCLVSFDGSHWLYKVGLEDHPDILTKVLELEELPYYMTLFEDAYNLTKQELSDFFIVEHIEKGLVITLNITNKNDTI